MSRSISRKAFLSRSAVAAAGAALPGGAMLRDNHLREHYFRITVVDEQTGRGVPMVELVTENNICHITDSNGVIAFYEPGLMEQEVFFYIQSHGYEYPADGFGYRGARLYTEPGKSAQLKVKRVNIAERLYRLTGQGIYRDSVLLGLDVPIEEPLLNSKVMGQDSALALPYRDQIYWFFGDTTRPAYPLGNFRTSGATSLLPGKGGLDPAGGVNLRYFVDDNGFSRAMIPLEGPGVVWLDGLLTVKDKDGRERMMGRYERLENLNKPRLEQGLVVFNDSTQTFERVKEFDRESRLHPQGWSTFTRVDQGTTYLYFPHPYPNLRVPATPDAIKDPARYEAYTPLAPGSRYQGTDSKLDRTGDGVLRWGWKRDTDPIIPSEQHSLVEAGKMKAEESPFRTVDTDSGEPVIAHRGTVCWNEFRKCWVMIFGQIFGTSLLGEIWYAEAPAPEGPWTRAKKIVTHNQYTFYNPIHHPFFDQKGGRFIYFQGTYTNSFSGNEEQTPYYDYNQVMYRLDLADERLRM